VPQMVLRNFNGTYARRREEVRLKQTDK